MARKKHGANPRSLVTKMDFDSEGYYKGYSVFAGRVLLDLIENRPRVFTHIKKSNSCTPPKRKHSYTYTYALKKMKSRFPADYMYFMEKAPQMGREYLQKCSVSYLERLQRGQRYMVHVSTQYTCFRCASLTVAIYWLRKTMADTQFFSAGGIPASLEYDTVRYTLNKKGIVHLVHSNGYVKITRIKS